MNAKAPPPEQEAPTPQIDRTLMSWHLHNAGRLLRNKGYPSHAGHCETVSEWLAAAKAGEPRAAESEPTDDNVGPAEYVAFEAWFRALPEPEKTGKHQSWIGWHARAKLSQESQAAPLVLPNREEVICPKCVHQFRAIPVQVQRLLLDSGHEPPFLAAPLAPKQESHHGP